MTPPPPVVVSPAAGRTLAGLALAGLAAAAAGHFLAPGRMWASWLLASYYAVGLGLAGLCFVAIHYVTGATWSIAIRRVPEALAGTLPLAALALAVVLVAHPHLYPWTANEARVGTEAAGTAVEPAFRLADSHAFKHWWLSRPFFLARSAVYLAIWIAFAIAIRRRSRRQDQDGDQRWTRANARLSAGFLVAFALTFTLASFDWIMSLEPEWHSTVFAVYNFAGVLLGGLAAWIALVVWLEGAGPLKGILTGDHLHDLGKLLFGFSTFWMYIWFSQYMLIWYANIPEEAAYFVARTQGGWLALFLLNVALNWAVPFLVLMRRDAKRHRTALMWVAAVVLVGRWLDLYLMIFPPVVGARPAIGVWEIGLTAGGASLFGLALVRALAAAPAVPIRDPQLAGSLQYHSG